MKHKHTLLGLLVALFFLVGSSGLAFAGEGMTGEGDHASSSSTKSVKGELLKIDGEYYVVKNRDGKELRLHVNKDTEKSGTLNPGDTIEAEANKDNHAISIKQAHMDSQPDAGMGR